MCLGLPEKNGWKFVFLEPLWVTKPEYLRCQSHSPKMAVSQSLPFAYKEPATWRLCLMLSPQLSVTVSWSLSNAWAITHTHTLSNSHKQTAEADKTVLDRLGLNSGKHTVCFAAFSHVRPYNVCQKTGMEVPCEAEFTPHLFHLCRVKGRRITKQHLILAAYRGVSVPKLVRCCGLLHTDSVVVCFHTLFQHQSPKSIKG